MSSSSAATFPNDTLLAGWDATNEIIILLEKCIAYTLALPASSALQEDANQSAVSNGGGTVRSCAVCARSYVCLEDYGLHGIESEISNGAGSR